MFCKNCGKRLGPEVNFCPACGTSIAAPTSVLGESPASYGGTKADDNRNSGEGSGRDNSWSGTGQPYRRMVRPRSPRVLGGVCAAFALHFGWDIQLVRIITVVLALLSGIGILAYLACWIVIPEAQYALPAQSR